MEQLARGEGIITGLAKPRGGPGPCESLAEPRLVIASWKVEGPRKGLSLLPGKVVQSESRHTMAGPSGFRSLVAASFRSHISKLGFPEFPESLGWKGLLELGEGGREQAGQGSYDWSK